MSSLRMMNLSCNDIHAEWVGRVCRFRRGVCRGALASGNCCVICNLVLLRLFFTAEREEDWEFDRGINLCLRLLTEVCVCVSVSEQKPRLYINQATIFSDPNALLCAYFFFFFILCCNIWRPLRCPQLLFTGIEDCRIARLGQLIFSHWLKMLSLAELIPVRPDLFFLPLCHFLSATLEFTSPSLLSSLLLFPLSPFQWLLSGWIILNLLRQRVAFVPRLLCQSLRSITGGNFPSWRSSVCLSASVCGCFSHCPVTCLSFHPVLPSASHLFSDRW